MQPFFFLLLILPSLLAVPLQPIVTVAADAANAALCTTTASLRTYEKCIALPTQGASLAWTYHPRNATLDVAFSGSFISPSGWVAWGINPDSPSMTGTRALAAFSDPSSGSLLLLPFVLDPSVKLQSAPLGYSPTIHPTTASDLASRATIDVVSTATEVPPAASATLRAAHAVLNSLSWGSSCRPASQWLATCAVQLGGADVVLRARGGAGERLPAGRRRLRDRRGDGEGVARGDVLAAPGLGVAAVVAGGLQSAALLFRPKTTHRFRKDGGDGARRDVLEAGLLPRAGLARRELRRAGGQRVGRLLPAGGRSGEGGGQEGRRGGEEDNEGAVKRRLSF
uniref:DOMON domain-containing protein n=1 Tax=Ananas comosus var. bracteatus TaxID=296719 RepID=A0A6V7Q3Y0_ANACO|nr:unnamed protein product [Ananas comosus var. bracteatus]